MATTLPHLAERLHLAIEMAREAGDVTRRFFRRSDLKVESKADNSPVTAADRAAEELLRERIAKRFGDDGIIGEELGTRDGTSGYQWVLDPIDGTKSFIHGVPLYTTLVAVLENDVPRIGVIHAPATGELVYAAQGGGCWYTPDSRAEAQSAKVSKIARLDQSLLLTSEIEGFKNHRPQNAFDVFVRLQRQARLARTWGDGYGYLLVATGRAEVMIDPVMNLWDAAPMQTIIEEAGGQFTDWQGNPTIRAGESLATNGLVTDEVLTITRT
jgi:histidinol phosphatase-like enzyme (inositol monophosphatase family)